MLPMVKPREASFLYEQILETRDKLNLSPDDPIADILDRRFAEHEDDHKKESAELRTARQTLDAKAQEVQRTQGIAGAVAEGNRPAGTETRRRAATRQGRRADVADDPALKELRRKVEELKSALKERHHERNDLRRDLQKAHTDLETLRQNAAPAAPDEAEPRPRGGIIAAAGRGGSPPGAADRISQGISGGARRFSAPRRPRRHDHDRAGWRRANRRRSSGRCGSRPCRT